MSKKIQRLTMKLPPTRCTPDMYKRITNLAKRKKMNLSEVQREALSLFLLKADNKLIVIDKESINQSA